MWRIIKLEVTLFCGSVNILIGGSLSPITLSWQKARCAVLFDKLA